MANAERNTVGSVLQAYWAKKDKDTWGIVLVNATENFSAVHNVELKYESGGKEHTKIFPFLPSGKFFIQSGTQESFPEFIECLSDYKPILESKKHFVRVAFTTADKKQWHWSPEQGLY